MNRVTTHEIGHGLNLYHTFQGNSCSETDCSSQGDRVCDTPPTVSNSTSCNSPACGGTQQVENYMDYTSQNCKNMFTEGQKTRMRTALTNSRSTLLTSSACVPVSQSDIGIDQILTPDGNLCSGNTAPVIAVRNFGASTVTSCVINYAVDGVNQSPYTFSGSIASGEVTNITLPNINASAGSHNFSVSTSSPNGQSDEFPSNDNATSTFSVVSGSTLTLTFRLDNYGTDNTWNIVNDQGTVVSQGGPYLDGQSGTIITEQVCVSTGCYTFNFMDSHGDGLLGAAYYELVDAQQGVVAEGNNNIGSQESTTFCLTGGGPTGDAPVAQFSANIQSICVGEAINFTDMSTGAPTAWSWNFQGASNSLSTSQNPFGITYNSPGTYTVTMTASNNFGTDTETKTGYITVGDGPSVLASVSDASCNGMADGQITLTVSGGTAPYTYSWSNGMNTPTITGLAAGTYSVMVTGTTGCGGMSFYTVGEPSAMMVNIQNISPDQDNAGVGAASVNVTGGTPPYNFSWSNGSGAASLSNVMSGTYEVTVVDANGCSESLTLNISNQDSNNTSPPTANFMVNNESVCSGGTVNFIDMSTNSPASWAWEFPGASPSNSSMMNPSNIRYDLPGEYDVTLTVTNANGSDTKMVMNYIHSFASPTLVANVQNVSCFGFDDGSIDLGVSNAAGTYTYNWSNGGTFEDVNGLVAGAYNVQVTDMNGCVSVNSFDIAEPPALQVSVDFMG